MKFNRMSGSFLTRLVACLVAVVAVLQLVHLVLLNQLETRRLEEISHLQRDLQPNQKNEREVAQPLRRAQLEVTRRENIDLNENELHQRLTTSAVLDSSGKYSISYNIAGPKRQANNNRESSDSLPVNLQSQASSKRDNGDFLIDEDEDSHPSSDSLSPTLVTWSDRKSLQRKLFPLLDRWQGPISLVIYSSNSSASSVNELIHLVVKARACSELVRSFVTFHVVVAGGSKGHLAPSKKFNRKTKKQGFRTINFSHFNPDIYECSDLLSPDPSYNQDHRSNQSSASENANNNNAPVPINLLRNVGRKGVTSEYFLESPIDLLPSSNLRERFQQMLLRNRRDYNVEGERVVYVLPSFEIKDDVSFVPNGKSEMVRLVRNYEARPYGFETCWKCQVRTDYDAWYRGPEKGNGQRLSTLYEVLWKDPWSPFFIAPIQSPLFPEEFDSSSSLLSSISHLCELHTAGYKFAVLNEAFLVHVGYRKEQGVGGEGNSGEKSKFKSFKAELRNKYPHSTRRCY